MNDKYLVAASLLIAIIIQLPFGKQKDSSRKSKLMLIVFAGLVGIAGLVMGLAPIELTVNGIPAANLPIDVAEKMDDFLYAGKVFSLLIAAGAILFMATLIWRVKSINHD